MSLSRSNNCLVGPQWSRWLLAGVTTTLLVVGVAVFSHEGRGELLGHGGFVKGVAVSADGATALTASFDYTVIYWDLGEQRAIRVLNEHEGGVNAVAFLPKAAKAISASDDGSLILWICGVAACCIVSQATRARQ